VRVFQFLTSKKFQKRFVTFQIGPRGDRRGKKNLGKRRQVRGSERDVSKKFVM